MNPPAAVISTLSLPWFDHGRVRIGVLRTDLVDPDMPGNKYYKLRYNLARARHDGHDTILSFGGPWSNHLHALAAAGRRAGFRTIGVIRGEAPPQPGACLRDLAANGMTLHYVTREAYRNRHGAAFLEALRRRFGHFYLVPEGGANEAGIRGCQAMLPPGLARDWDRIVVACGTGTTLAGLITAQTLPVLGIQVLKGAGYLTRAVTELLVRHGLEARCAWHILDTWHRGGYARVDRELLAFTARLQADSGIPFEPVYSGKVMMALQAMAAQGELDAGSRVLFVHGGGLQGARGFETP